MGVHSFLEDAINKDIMKQAKDIVGMYEAVLGKLYSPARRAQAVREVYSQLMEDSEVNMENPFADMKKETHDKIMSKYEEEL